MLMVRIIADMVARKASFVMRLASRYMAKKMVAIAPNIVPTMPESTLATGRILHAESRLPPRVRGVDDDEDAERSAEERRIERLEDEEAGNDAKRAAGQNAGELAPVDVRAAAANDRDRRHDPDQAPRRREDLHRDGEREERQSQRAAEAERAAQREIKEKDRGAVRELEGREGLEQATRILGKRVLTPFQN